MDATNNAAAAAQLELAPAPKDWAAMSKDEQFALVGRNADRARGAIAELAARGAMFVVSHSAGKDSQALALFIEANVRASQIVYVHATLGRFEWDGVIKHIKATVANPAELHLAQAVNKAGETKTFEDMVLSRGMFPTPAIRQCTSDLKRGPIAKVIRRLSKEREQLLIVECVGVRAHESDRRRRATVNCFSFDKANSKAGREWYSMSPIADWTTEQVFAYIAAAGQKPHAAYQAGMSRLSCCFCIMANRADQKLAAKLRPELYAEMVALEQHVGHTMSMTREPLEQTTGVAADQGKVRRHLSVLQAKSAPRVSPQAKALAAKLTERQRVAVKLLDAKGSVSRKDGFGTCQLRSLQAKGLCTSELTSTPLGLAVAAAL